MDYLKCAALFYGDRELPVKDCAGQSSTWPQNEPGIRVVCADAAHSTGVYYGPKYLAFGAMLAGAGLSFLLGEKHRRTFDPANHEGSCIGLSGATIGLALMPLAQAIAGLLRIVWIAAQAVLVTALACLAVMPWVAWLAAGAATYSTAWAEVAGRLAILRTATQRSQFKSSRLAKCLENRFCVSRSPDGTGR